MPKKQGSAWPESVETVTGRHQKGAESGTTGIKRGRGRHSRHQTEQKTALRHQKGQMTQL